MYWSYDHSPRQANDWGSESNDYLDHISKLERTTTRINEKPYYPAVHNIFKNSYPYGEHGTLQEQPQKKTTVKPRKMVRVSDHVGIAGSDVHNENSDALKTSVDTRADGFIHQKRRGFALCKWQTFKLDEVQK